MSKIDSDFAKKIKSYGSQEFDACYNCGNCTAVCSLTDHQENFPRMMIRYGILGLKREILSSSELWLCYSCGECSETCPRQANPGEYMSALRRYAIAHYEPTGLTRMIFTSNPFSILFSLAIAVLLGFFLLTLQPETTVARWIFQYMPFEVIHDLGMVLFAITGLLLVIGMGRMVYFLNSKNNNDNVQSKEKKGFKNLSSVIQVFKEILSMTRHKRCNQEEEEFWNQSPWYLQPWFVHWSIMWGFLGLLLATTLDFIFKDPATDIWWPSRILGTISGVLMMYGATLSIIYRLRKISATYQYTTLADWMFLIFLWLAGLTGFWIEIAVAMDANQYMNHMVFIIHTVISMELVLLFAFSKFAHAIYRPVALYYHFMNLRQ